MYNFNDLEKMLREGVTADEIAQAFTKNLNSAIDAVKPTPMEMAGVDLAKAWNHMIDLYLEDNDRPAFLDNDDDLYISGETATRLFKESMDLLNKMAPIWNAIASLAEDDDVKINNTLDKKNYKDSCNKKPPVEKNTDGEDEFDNFDNVMKKFLSGLGV